MQEPTGFYLDSETIVREDELPQCIFPLFPGDRIFFVGDLGAGKTTFIRALLRAYYSHPDLVVRSPTYTYYQKYRGQMTKDNGQWTDDKEQWTMDRGQITGNESQGINDKGQIKIDNLEMGDESHEPGTIKSTSGSDLGESRGSSEGPDIYHFDLYRIDDPGDLELIGALEIFDNPTTICLIEWPEVLGDRVSPTVIADLEKYSENERKLSIYRMSTNLERSNK